MPYAEIIIPSILTCLAAIGGWVLRVEKKTAKIDEVHADMQEVKENVSAIMWHLIQKNGQNGNKSTK